MKVCSIEGCGKPTRGYGFCNAHYLRSVRNGSPTAGKTSRGAPMEWMDEALFRKTDECFFFPFGRSSDGRSNIKFNGRTMPTYRLMCMSAHGNPPSPKHQAAHSCGMGHLSCVNPRHLRWATDAENKRDRKIHDRIKGPEAVRLIADGTA